MKLDDDVYIYLRNFGYTDEELKEIHERNSYLERVLDVDVEARVNYFRSLEMSDEEIRDIGIIEPNIFVYSLNRMKKIQKQYINEGMSIEEYKNMLLNNIHILSVD